MELARDEIIERFEHANARAQKKQQLIESALGGVYAYLVELHKEYKLGPRDPKPREIEPKLMATIRQRLEAILLAPRQPKTLPSPSADLYAANSTSSNSRRANDCSFKPCALRCCKAIGSKATLGTLRTRALSASLASSIHIVAGATLKKYHPKYHPLVHFQSFKYFILLEPRSGLEPETC
jgi:hypothetical protein